MNAAVILARKGSKGCPGKNLRLLNGVPLIVRAIRTAQASGVCDEVIVASDDYRMVDIADREGACGVLRDPVSDSQTSEAGMIEISSHFVKYQNVAMIQCTAPFMMPVDVSAGVHYMERKGHDSVCTVAPFHGVVWDTEPTGFRQPRQERPPEFIEAGSVYWMKTSSFMIYQSRFCGNTGVLMIPQERCFEIDSEADFAIAECLIKNIKELDNEYHW
jgi:N-acylneuraminate cytidylyltransferase